MSDVVYELSGEISYHASLAPFSSGVYQFYLGIVGTVVSLFELDKRMSSCRGVIYFFKGRSRRAEDDVAAMDK